MTHSPSAEPSPAARHPDTLIGQIRRGLAEAPLDCGSHHIADAVLDRIHADEELTHRVGGLADARRMRDAILMVVALLGEIDDLTIDEPDRTVFVELADLFRDIADFAEFGTASVRRAAGQEYA